MKRKIENRIREALGMGKKKRKEGIAMIVGILLFSSAFFMCFGGDDTEDSGVDRMEILGSKEEGGVMEIHLILRDTNSSNLLQVTAGQFSFITNDGAEYDVNSIETVNNRLKTDDHEWEGIVKIEYTDDGVDILKFREKYEDEDGRIYEGDLLTEYV